MTKRDNICSRYDLLARLWIGLCLGFALAWGASAEEYPERLSSRAQISMLIAEPSDEAVFTLYGHAGLRVEDMSQGLDVVFNYGIFDFRDDFLLRFIAGKTDYIVLPQETRSYFYEYSLRGSAVHSLVLEMDSLEMNKAWQYLMWNIHPNNRTYRYNFFYDNCATRPLDIYLNAVGDSLVLAKQEASTWREEINKLEAREAWLVLGTDLLLGSPTDEVMQGKERFFLPDKLLELRHARLTSGRSVVRHHWRQEPNVYGIGENYANVDKENDKETSWLSRHYLNFVAGLLLLGSIYYIRSARRGQSFGLWYHALVFTLAGLFGCLVFYIAYLSEHPHRLPNFNLWVIHPLHLLLALPLMSLRKLRRGAYIYHFANFVAQCAFLALAYFLPQHFNIAVYLLSATLGALSLSYVLRAKASS